MAFVFYLFYFFNIQIHLKDKFTKKWKFSRYLLIHMLMESLVKFFSQ